MKELAVKYRHVLVLILFGNVLSLSSPSFFKFSNITNVLWSVRTVGIISVMATFLILNGKIDLSVSSTVALSAIVVVELIQEKQMPVPAAILVGLLIGAAAGAVNGIIVANTSVPDFIATFSMSSILTGIAQLLTGGKTISIISNKAYTALGTGKLFQIPYPIYILFFMFLLAWFMLNYTTFGRKCYLCGGNPKSAKLSGIRTKKTLFLAYLFTGMAAAASGIVLSALTQQASNDMGSGYELDVIASVVIGGTLMSGGSGSMGGTLFGVLLIGLIDNGMNLLHFPGAVEPVVKGIIIVIAVTLNNTMMQRIVSARKPGKEGRGRTAAL